VNYRVYELQPGYLMLKCAIDSWNFSDSETFGIQEIAVFLPRQKILQLLRCILAVKTKKPSQLYQSRYSSYKSYSGTVIQTVYSAQLRVLLQILPTCYLIPYTIPSSKIYLSSSCLNLAEEELKFKECLLLFLLF